MELQGKYAFAESRIRAVREIENQPVVEIVPNVSALRDDHHVVSIVELEELLETGLIDECFGDLLAVISPRCFLTD